MLKYFIIHKPFNVLAQFSPMPGKKTLKDFFNVSHDIYPIGRLDFDSEGLLILTNDKSLNHRLLDPKYNHIREYWVQVEGWVSEGAILQIQNGVSINHNGEKYTTKNCKASIFCTQPLVGERFPPIRVRKSIPDTWIKLILSEGKNRQVRKMTAAVGHPTLRLIRYGIEGITLSGLLPGEMKDIAKGELYNLLKIKS